MAAILWEVGSDYRLPMELMRCSTVSWPLVAADLALADRTMDVSVVKPQNVITHIETLSEIAMISTLSIAPRDLNQRNTSLREVLQCL